MLIELDNYMKNLLKDFLIILYHGSNSESLKKNLKNMRDLKIFLNLL